MGILETAAPAIVVCTRDRARATTFYREVLGLRFVREDRFAAIFKLGAGTLRVSTVPNWTAHEHTILGSRVEDVRATVIALRKMGIEFISAPGLTQDELGVFAAPDRALRVAWFKDPDGNVLSVTDAA